MRQLFIIILPLILLSACIGEDIIVDFVEESVRITNPVDTLGLGTTYQFEAMFTNQVGQTEQATFIWESLDPEIASVTAGGLAEGLALGQAKLLCSVDLTNKIITDTIEITVGEKTVSNNDDRTGRLRTTSSYQLEGSFSMRAEGDDVILEFANDYEASSALPGLYVYLTNNPNTSNGAYEIGAVAIFSGAHEYTIQGVGLNDYSHVLYFCKPFGVKVGDGAFEE
jgi:hypothetical protein